MSCASSLPNETLGGYEQAIAHARKVNAEHTLEKAADLLFNGAPTITLDRSTFQQLTLLAFELGRTVGNP